MRGTRQRRPWGPWVFLAAAGLFFWGLFLHSEGRLRTAGAQGPSMQAPTPAQIIGVEVLERRLGDTAPTGRGVRTGHVEGPLGNYMPNVKRAAFRGVEFKAASGESTTNGHADMTARTIYGSSGLAPGIDDVWCYANSHWMGEGYLRLGSDQAPGGSDRELFTHSWIGGSGPADAETLRRVDWVVDTLDVVMAVGVNNGKDTPVPPLLASAYNVIAVGAASGNSSGGYTQVEGSGRCKPDVVAPAGLTSVSTPMVAAVAARLVETAQRLETAAPTARKAEVIKAVLLAGAEKPANWQPKPGKPLDEHLGAGSVRADLSYDLLTSGRIKPGRVRKRYGWDFNTLKPGAQAVYRFDVPAAMGEFSIALVWHRRIGSRRMIEAVTGRWIAFPRLADLDLGLIAIDDKGQEKVLAVSESELDNVEHIYVRDLPAGRYRLQVVRKDKEDEAWEYALAWRLEPQRSPQTAPASAPHR